MAIELSLIIPAYNEEKLIHSTLAAVLQATAFLDRHSCAVGSDQVEIIVVDNASTDRTRDVIQAFDTAGRVCVVSCPKPGAARARNWGARIAQGRILVFVDADTIIPPDALERIFQHCDSGVYQAGITRLAALDGGWRARFWWFFWGQVRRLPLARAKAMSAFMFCTRWVFDQFGPFDESVAIGEEWPLLAGLFRHYPKRLIYDRTLTAMTSSRRMERQPFGYIKTYLKYLWVILHRSGRRYYSNRIR